MATFQYKAYRDDQEPVEGQIEADDLHAARLSLEEQGLTVESIQPLAARQALPDTPPSPARPAEAEQLALKRQFRRVLATGKPLAPALLAYAQELPAGSRRRLERIAYQLQQGHDPSAELAAGQIDEQWMPLLAAGASSGDPGQILSGIIDESQRVGDLRRQLAGALGYPLLLLVVLSVLVLLFAWWLVPAFEEMFSDFGTELPDMTRLAFAMSEAIRQSLGLVVVIPLLVLAAILLFFAFGPRSGPRDWIIQRIPLLGSTVRILRRARFTRCLADLIEAKVPVADALRISGRTTGQTALRGEANRLATELDSAGIETPGTPAVRQALPRTVVHVLHLDADPGAAAAEILRELSWMYDQQARDRLAWISSVTSPVFVVVLGVFIGLYVVALFAPLFSLVQCLTSS